MHTDLRPIPSAFLAHGVDEFLQISIALGTQFVEVWRGHIPCLRLLRSSPAMTAAAIRTAAIMAIAIMAAFQGGFAQTVEIFYKCLDLLCQYT